MVGRKYPSFAIPVAQNYTCGSFLISAEILATAGHCNFPVGTEAFEVDSEICIGGNKRDCNDALEKRTIAEVRPHPDFNEKNFDNDIMLMKLSGPTGLPLWETNTDASRPLKFEIVGVIGYGDTADGGPSWDVLREVDLAAVVFDDCNVGLNAGAINNDINVCAGIDVGGKGFSDGDSGGPMFSRATILFMGSCSLPPARVEH